MTGLYRVPLSKVGNIKIKTFLQTPVESTLRKNYIDEIFNQICAMTNVTWWVRA